MLKVTMKDGKVYYTTEVEVSGILYITLQFTDCETGEYICYEAEEFKSITLATEEETNKVVTK